MSNPTIKQQIHDIDSAFVGGEWAEVMTDEMREQIGALSQRRLNAGQRQWIEILQDGIEAHDLEEGAALSGKMSNQLSKYRVGYKPSVAASGAKSLNNGDDLARFLEYKEAKLVCMYADEFTPIKDGQSHWDRYARLNEGQRRMNSGNKLRAAIRRGDLVVNENTDTGELTLEAS